MRRVTENEGKGQYAIMEIQPNIVSLGLMSGTSLDAIDLAIIASDGAANIETLAFDSIPLASSLRTDIRALITRAHNETVVWEQDQETLSLRARVTKAHIDAAEGFLKKHSYDVSLIGFHGQTVWHDPQNGVTVQLSDGQLMANHFGVDVIDQFRLADVAFGGQGAPLVPVYHAALCTDFARPVAVLNIGGVSNVTYVGNQAGDQDTLIAFDTGPGNALLNDWVKKHTSKEYDPDGIYAQNGVASSDCVMRLMEHPYFAVKPPKSLDRNSFNPSNFIGGMSLEDGAATLTEFTVAAIHAAQRYFPEPALRWIVCGGGRHNKTLMARLTERLTGDVVNCDELSWQGDAIEAQAFAYLAIRSLRGLPLSFPETTGASQPVLGGHLSKPKA